jgi:hypothetical protein
MVSKKIIRKTEKRRKSNYETKEIQRKLFKAVDTRIGVGSLVYWTEEGTLHLVDQDLQEQTPYGLVTDYDAEKNHYKIAQFSLSYLPNKLNICLGLQK